MKSIIYISTLFLLAASHLMGQNTKHLTKADQILGLWQTETKDRKIEIFKSGDHYCGKFIWGVQIFEPDGKTSRKDINNPDTKLKSRALLNLVILSDFTYDNEVWDNGTIYEPSSGKVYSCNMKIKNGKLDIRGYIGISLFGKTVVWERVK